MVDYVAQLREGILDAYVGIVAGFKAADKRKFIFPIIPIIPRRASLLYFHHQML